MLRKPDGGGGELGGATVEEDTWRESLDLLHCARGLMLGFMPDRAFKDACCLCCHTQLPRAAPFPPSALCVAKERVRCLGATLVEMLLGIIFDDTRSPRFRYSREEN